MHEIQETMTPTRGVKVKPNFIAGAVLGAGLALLLAPAAGRDTRRRIGQTAQRLGGGARNLLDRARGTLEGMKHDARSAIESGRAEYQRSRVARARRPTTIPSMP